MYANTHNAMSKVYSILMFTFGMLAIVLAGHAECNANDTDLESLFTYRGDSLEQDVRAFVAHKILPFLGSEFAAGEQPDYILLTNVQLGIYTGYFKGENFFVILINETEEMGVVVKCDATAKILGYATYRLGRILDVTKRFLEPFNFHPRLYDLYNGCDLVAVGESKARVLDFLSWPIPEGSSYDIASWKLREQMFIDIALHLSLAGEHPATERSYHVNKFNRPMYVATRYDSIFISGSEVDALVGAIDHEEITVDTAVDGRFVMLRLDVQNSRNKESFSQRFFLVCLSGRYGKKSFSVEVARDSDENRTYRLRTQHTF